MDDAHGGILQEEDAHGHDVGDEQTKGSDAQPLGEECTRGENEGLHVMWLRGDTVLIGVDMVGSLQVGDADYKSCPVSGLSFCNDSPCLHMGTHLHFIHYTASANTYEWMWK